MKKKAFVTLLIVSGGVGQCQFPSGTAGVAVLGELTTAQGRPNGSHNAFTAQLQSRDHPGEFQRSTVTWDGHFEFRAVQPGFHSLTMLNAHGVAVREEPVMVHGGGGPVHVRVVLPASGSQAGGSISMRRMAHKPPKAARREYDQAAAAFRKKRWAEYRRHLESAVALDEEWFEPREALGVMLLKQGDARAAEPHLARAAAIDDGCAAALVNWSISLLQLGDHEAAERLSRKALRLDPQSPFAHYATGLAMAGQKRYNEETVEHFRLSAGAIPKAREAEQWVRSMLPAALPPRPSLLNAE